MSALLRICTAGNVDDGKSTLIGRLLHDSKSVYEDQVRSVKAASRHRGAGPIDFSLFTDGLKAEREQGITIDVAYRYFATALRKFILADTPGHEQYTRNMATGASTADVAILLVDARHGLQTQSARHARIARLLGISDFVLAVNKMDLVDFREDVFRTIVDQFQEHLEGAGTRTIPISALKGDNVTRLSPRTTWYSGPTLLEHLETVDVVSHATNAPFRFPVQLVLRPNEEFRGYAGRILSGRVSVGDPVSAWPSGRTTRIARIVTRDGDLETAAAPASVALVLRDNLDLSRGDTLTVGAPSVGRNFVADIVWMDERPLDPKRLYRLKHTTQTVSAELNGALLLNEIGALGVTTSRPLIFDAYSSHRATGSFVLIDADSNFTAGAGMITTAAPTIARPSRWRANAARVAAAARDAASSDDAALAVERLLEELI